MRIGMWALLLLTGGVLEAQSLEQNYQEKIKKPFVSKVPWALGYEKAIATAKKEDKPILAYFTRSYAP